MATDSGDKPRFARRLILKSLAAGAVLWEPACGAPPLENDAVRAHGVAPAHPEETPIRAENRRLGSDGMSLSKPANSHEVEGYASTTSAIAGESVSLYVNVNRTQGVRWDLYRIGYYQGHGARQVSSGPAVPVSPQVAPTISPHTGLIECAWDAAFSVTIDATWVTGYYLFKLTSDEGFESYVSLLVRESGRRAPLLAQASVTTWQAYNTWGGVSLYVNQLPKPKPFSGGRGYQVSFDRPYAAGVDTGFVEYAMVRWLEEQGYDVAYVTNVDLDRTPELLSERRLFISVGHDEYWSLAERNAVQSMRDQGLSLAFFGGNPAYRRIRWSPSIGGVERRIMNCYKSATLDPLRDSPDTTADYHSKPHARPENELVGLSWATWAHLEGFPCVVSLPDHWIYEGTGVSAGDSLGQIIGYEWDHVVRDEHCPAGLEVVAESPVIDEYGAISTAHASVYYPTESSFVFAAGTIGWAKGLSEKDVADPRVQRVTQNILRRAGLFPEAQVVSPAVRVHPISEGARSLVVAGTGSSGNSDGPALSAQFCSPAGVASGPDGEIYVCDTGNSLIRKISRNGQVTTLDVQIRPPLNAPTGIAVNAQGDVFVSDTPNHRIVVVRGDGTASVYAGRAHSAGPTDAPGLLAARFNYPRGLAIDSAGVLYIADSRNDSIRRADEVSGVTTLVTNAGGPSAVTVSADGFVYYLASRYGAVIKVALNGELISLANPNRTQGDRTGPGAQAALRPADGLVVAGHGLVFCDTGNNRVRTLAFDEANTVATLIGTGRGGNGTGAQTELCIPRGLCLASNGYAVADSENHRILLVSTALATPYVN